jgi:spore photoproduct lyase
MDSIYVEHDVAEHPQTLRICSRYPKARIIPIKRHSDIFNSRSQNFREQKRNPSLILARKHGKFIHPTPPGYHVGGKYNYYFSHMLNCIYDCRYCFLQGMYQSGNYVVFVNTEDFLDDISRKTEQHDSPSGYFSGYDCDSLALDPVTHFVNDCLDHFEQLPNAWLELRTKSTQIRPLLNRPALANVVVAYSLSPEAIVKAEEHGTPSLQKRLDALAKLQAHGWKVGLRFDPLLYSDDFEELYEHFFKQVFSAIDMPQVHSVSLGVFRLPKGFHRKLVRMYPESKLLAAPLNLRDSMMTYPEESETAMRKFCFKQLNTVVRDDQFFPCS